MAQVNDDPVKCPNPECGEDLPNDSDSSLYCWTCDLFYCPFCMNGTTFFADPSFCEHYLTNYVTGGYAPEFIDFVRDENIMEGVASEEDLDCHKIWEWELLERASQKMAELSVEEKVEHFGLLYPLWSGGTMNQWSSYMEETCSILGISFDSAFQFPSDYSSFTIYYSEIGGDAAWQRITPAIEKYKMGLAWLDGYARERM